MKKYMKRRVIAVVLVLVVVSFCETGWTVLSSETFMTLIVNFKKALNSRDLEAIEASRDEILADETAVNYLKANYPELFEKLTGELSESQYSRQWDIGDLGQEFSVDERQDNRSIVDAEANENRWDNRDLAVRFPNQRRLNNRELIQQRRRQDRSSGSFVGDEFLADDMSNFFILSISGVDSSIRQDLKSLLQDYFKMILSISERNYRDGVVEFNITSEANPEDFSDRLENKEFGPFHFELIRFHPDKLDFILK